MGSKERKGAKGTNQPKIGRVVKAKDGSGFTVVGKITQKLWGRLNGWDNPGRN